MVTYKQQYEEAKKAKSIKTLTPQMFKFTETNSILIGVYISQSLIGVSEKSKGYNQYVFGTDEGLVKIGPGSGFDSDVAEQLDPGVVYAIEWLGKVDISGGRTVNKYNVEELGMDEYDEGEPSKPAKDGKKVDQK